MSILAGEFLCQFLLACTNPRYGLNYHTMKKAKLILRRKARYDDGAIREMVVWELPEPVVGSLHSYKYRFFYGQDGERMSVMTMNGGKATTSISMALNTPIRSSVSGN